MHRLVDDEAGNSHELSRDRYESRKGEKKCQRCRRSLDRSILLFLDVVHELARTLDEDTQELAEWLRPRAQAGSEDIMLFIFSMSLSDWTLLAAATI